MASEVFVFNATASVISTSASLSIFTKIMNTISSSSEIIFELKGHDYSSHKFPFFYEKSKGSSIKLIIKGKPLVCKYIVEKLTGYDPDDDQYTEEDDNVVDILRRKIDKLESENNIQSEKFHINWMSFFKDMFCGKNTFKIDFAGRSYQKTKILFYKKEKGQKLSINISGKPAFAKAMIDHLNQFSPRIIKFLYG